MDVTYRQEQFTQRKEREKGCQSDISETKGKKSLSFKGEDKKTRRTKLAGQKPSLRLYTKGDKTCTLRTFFTFILFVVLDSRPTLARWDGLG